MAQDYMLLSPCGPWYKNFGQTVCGVGAGRGMYNDDGSCPFYFLIYGPLNYTKITLWGGKLCVPRLWL